MSNKNDGSSEFAIVFGLIGASALLLIFVFYILGLVLAAVFTVISICAWNKPLQLGQNVVTPEEAQFFVYAGITGACAIPMLAWLSSVLCGFQIHPDAWLHMYVGGYCFGSIGLTMLATNAGMFAPPAVEPVAPTLPAQIAPPPAPKPEPFRFASWEDEERPS
ncbi:hypothetical protein T281_14660 [Rhodomicrobium udaipurense JA643]|uniref:Uncharacterized protein n=1 Tax=Rhodomicrobium udaipurense TaxID=1202716 RepID=A0A8I1KI66_9HYPH|nr:hypothetical protein [Rhodomicrobium udaipurense]KAI93776.1 hypothetical protein T281_14660 [Rhodomicrobium udaipurense JA643]MBJ7544420.1 hypothetical protein [Rhodomicrobium udaipurense]